MFRIKTQEEVAKFIKEKMNDKGIKKSIDLSAIWIYNNIHQILP